MDKVYSPLPWAVAVLEPFAIKNGPAVLPGAVEGLDEDVPLLGPALMSGTGCSHNGQMCGLNTCLTTWFAFAEKIRASSDIRSTDEAPLVKKFFREDEKLGL